MMAREYPHAMSAAETDAEAEQARSERLAPPDATQDGAHWLWVSGTALLAVWVHGPDSEPEAGEWTIYDCDCPPWILSAHEAWNQRFTYAAAIPEPVRVAA